MFYWFQYSRQIDSSSKEDDKKKSLLHVLQWWRIRAKTGLGTEFFNFRGLQTEKKNTKQNKMKRKKKSVILLRMLAGQIVA